LLGLRSKSSVAALVARLKLAGFLDSTPDRRLAPTRRFFARPLAESPVRAGMPEAIEGRRRRRPHHRRLPDRAPVLHRADPREGRLDDGTPASSTGTSWWSRRKPKCAQGEIVVAIVDNQFTLKRLDLEAGKFILRAENKAYAPIRPEGELEIFGVMVGLVRKL
jgi:repressor LexA